MRKTTAQKLLKKLHDSGELAGYDRLGLKPEIAAALMAVTVHFNREVNFRQEKISSIERQWLKLLAKMSKMIDETGKSLGDNRPQVKARFMKICDAFGKAGVEFSNTIHKKLEE